MRNTNLVFRREVEAGDTLGNHQLRWKLKPWEEMRSLREDEKGTENGTFYIIIVFCKRFTTECSALLLGENIPK